MHTETMMCTRFFRGVLGGGRWKDTGIRKSSKRARRTLWLLLMSRCGASDAWSSQRARGCLQSLLMSHIPQRAGGGWQPPLPRKQPEGHARPTRKRQFQQQSRALSHQSADATATSTRAPREMQTTTHQVKRQARRRPSSCQVTLAAASEARGQSTGEGERPLAAAREARARGCVEAREGDVARLAQLRCSQQRAFRRLDLVVGRRGREEG